MQKTLGIFTVIALGVSCGPQSQESQLNQTWDRESDPRSSGYTGKLDAATLGIDFVANTMRLPWADTYWPNVNKGLSYRWASLTRQPVSEVGLVDFLRTHLEESSKAQPSLYLSPAEKYDIIYRWRYGQQLGSDSLSGLQATLNEKELAIQSASDLSLKRQLIGEMNQALRAEQPLLQSLMPLSRLGWETWTDRTSNASFQYLNQEGTGSNWGWEGICHGWAPAALFAEAPQHVVKLKLDEQEIFLTEGDIRGLLTYAWASYSPNDNQYFVGRRCNIDVENQESRGPLDSTGRNTYGSLRFSADGQDSAFALVDESSPTWLKRNWIIDRFNGNANMRLYSVRMLDRSETTRQLLELNYYSSQARFWYTSYYMSESLGEIRAFVLNRSMNGITSPVSVDLNGCGDVNPAVLHTTILKALKDEEVGFVIDRTQSGQVWNQPVHGATVQVGSKEKVLDLQARYPSILERLAPGTAYVMPVKVQLRWSYEPTRPQFDYTTNDDQSYAAAQSDLAYILEFDTNDQLIGGEWGTLSEPQPADQVPDFIYGFKKDSKPVDRLSDGFDYSGIIGQIHACSLRQQADGIETYRNQQLSYVNCTIQKASP